MALADYFARSALAAAQVLGGAFEESRFKELLDTTPVGVALDEDAAGSPEGRAIADLAVRLLARLYPAVSIVGSGEAVDEVMRLRDLAKRISPAIALDESATLGICIGASANPFADCIYVGSDGWDAFVSVSGPRTLGDSEVPYGAGAAACLGAANLFRRIFLPGGPETADDDLVFSTFEMRRRKTTLPTGVTQTHEAVVLVGAGAIGNAALWALGRGTLAGTLHLVDPQTMELSNLQRYVLAERSDDGAVKVEVAKRSVEQSIDLVPHQLAWAEFANTFGYQWYSVLVALDSAHDRRAVQASLPHWIANSWTQPGDLGVSVHPSFTDGGACLSCLYLEDAKRKNEDELIAEALGVPELVPQVRQFLHTSEGLNPQFLDLVATRLDQPPTLLAPFVGRHVRELYVEGICGGAVLPLGHAGIPDSTLHVPLAHQSALAGVLLAAAYERSLSDHALTLTQTSKIDLLRKLDQVEAMPAKKRGDGRCICEDADFRDAYTRKWATKARPRGKKRRGTGRPAV